MKENRRHFRIWCKVIERYVYLGYLENKTKWGTLKAAQRAVGLFLKTSDFSESDLEIHRVEVTQTYDLP
jgi:hypothetical protein